MSTDFHTFFIKYTQTKMNNILLFKTEYCSNIKFMDKFLKALFYKVFCLFNAI